MRTADDYRYEDDLKIPPDYGLGISWRNDQGVLCTTKEDAYHHGDFGGKRIAWLSLTTYKGISVDALHWYAHVEVYGLSWSEEDDNDEHSHSGYGGQEAKPLSPFFEGIKLQAQRKIKAGEKDAWGRPLGKRGELTGRFNSVEEAKLVAIELFKKKFEPGWVLLNKDDAYIGEPSEMVAET